MKKLFIQNRNYEFRQKITKTVIYAFQENLNDKSSPKSSKVGNFALLGFVHL